MRTGDHSLATAALLVVFILIASEVGVALGAPAANSATAGGGSGDSADTTGASKPTIATGIRGAASVARAGSAARDTVNAELRVGSVVLAGSLAQPRSVSFDLGRCEPVPETSGGAVDALVWWDVFSDRTVCNAVQLFASPDCSGAPAAKYPFTGYMTPIKMGASVKSIRCVICECRAAATRALLLPRVPCCCHACPAAATRALLLPRVPCCCHACPAAATRLYLPSFSTNLVSGADLQDQGVDQFTPASQRVTQCTCARTGRHLATFTRRPGSSLYTLTTTSPSQPASGQVAASSQVFAAASGSGPESAPCSCRLLSHQTLLWHHRLGHPSLPSLRGMASRVLVSNLPRSLPPLPPGPAPTCVPCVEGRQRAAPHSSEFPPTEAPLQTLHMDVRGPARVRGQGHERYFLLVVDDYLRYTTVVPLRSKGDVAEVLIDWIRAARLQLRESFGSDFPVLRLHSDRGGEFSSARLGAFCRAQGIRQTFTLPASPQKNGIAERRIGMVMDVARTSMIHAAAPHFLWPFAVQYAAHQLNLQRRVSVPETSPTLRWTGKVGDASAFRVWGSRAFVRDLFADKLSPRAVPCVFLGFPPDAPGRCLSTVSSPPALRPFPRRRSSLRHVLPR
ncbi:unnamed protein product [Closterium sp. NIES-53]